MRLAYFDCFSGISGDMVLGALLDAGLPLEDLQAELDKLAVPGLRLESTPSARHAIAAQRCEVLVEGQKVTAADEHHLEPEDAAHQHDHQHHQHDHQHHHHDHQHHHHLPDILKRIQDSPLDGPVIERSVAVYHRLAAAEAEVHGLPPEKVHLHEVGALDAVADIVGAVAGLHLLGVDKVYSSPLRFGTGFTRCAHGRYPVPVPGVLALCQGIPTEQSEIRAELVTPTGAALITTLATAFGPAPPMVQTACGYGAGKRDLAEAPNLLRVRLGEAAQAARADRATLIEANIDDMNPEIFGYLFERLLGDGALDVFVTPVQMKKGRPGSLLSVLAADADTERLAALVLAETTTLGVRLHAVERRKLDRRASQVRTAYGSVRVKTFSRNGRPQHTPEYDDCVELARRHGVPLLDVYNAARAAAPEEEA